MHIAFINEGYPAPNRAVGDPFVQQFVWAMARQGHECTVISPTSLFERRHGPLPVLFATEDPGCGGKPVKVYRPHFISFSSRNLGWTHTGRWTQRAINRVSIGAIKQLSAKPDIVYGHFLYSAGYAALRAGIELSCPSVIGVGESYACPSETEIGESYPWSLAAFGVEQARRHFSTQGYFLPNSTPNGEMLINLLKISPERILVEPNGVDLGRMHPVDRTAMRNKFSISTDGFVAAFVGSNDERKGPQRLVAAASGIPGVSCILAGSGTDTIKSACIEKCGVVLHEVIPELLACADIFVLPTIAEGSCNSVIEAMACGLPIVTSNGRYMDDIVDEEVAIRVDPTDVRAIREAILKLKNDPERRQRMTEACLFKAKTLDINERAKRVTEWMKRIVARHSVKNNAVE
jgi:teichuronic acid biosynthesis glycosyltransferase TuaC